MGQNINNEASRAPTTWTPGCGDELFAGQQLGAVSDFSREVPLLSLFIPFLNLEGHNLGKKERVILSVIGVTEHDLKGVSCD